MITDNANDFAIISDANASTFCMLSMLMPIYATQLCHCAETNYIIEYIYDIRYKKFVTYFRNKENKTESSYIGKCMC